MKMKMLKLIEGVFEWTKIRFKVDSRVRVQLSPSSVDHKKIPFD